MVVVKILVNSELTEEEFGIQAYENNSDGQCEVQDDFHCIAEVDGTDTIFGTNDKNITVCLPLVDLLANEVVSKLRDRGVGNTYDDELSDEYTNDVLAPFAKAIADKAHEIMKQKYQLIMVYCCLTMTSTVLILLIIVQCLLKKMMPR